MTEEYKARYGRKEADDLFDGIKEFLADHKASKSKPEDKKDEKPEDKTKVKDIEVKDPAKDKKEDTDKKEDKPKKGFLDMLFGD